VLDVHFPHLSNKWGQRVPAFEFTFQQIVHSPETNSTVRTCQEAISKGNSSSNHPFSGANSLLVSGRVFFKSWSHKNLFINLNALARHSNGWVFAKETKARRPGRVLTYPVFFLNKGLPIDYAN